MSVNVKLSNELTLGGNPTRLQVDGALKSILDSFEGVASDSGSKVDWSSLTIETDEEFVWDKFVSVRYVTIRADVVLI